MRTYQALRRKKLETPQEHFGNPPRSESGSSTVNTVEREAMSQADSAPSPDRPGSSYLRAEKFTFRRLELIVVDTTLSVQF